MQTRGLRRLVALGLALALAAPAAWAVPGGSGGLAGGGMWGWVAELLERWVAKSGPCIDPLGKTAACLPILRATPPGRERPDKDGPCITSDGKPSCAPGTHSLPLDSQLRAQISSGPQSR